MTDDQEKPRGKQVPITGAVAIGFLVLGVMIGWYAGKNFVQSEKVAPLVKGISDEVADGGEEVLESATRTFSGFVEDVGDDSLSVATPELNADEETQIVDVLVTDSTQITATFQEQDEEQSRVIEDEDSGIVLPPLGEDSFTYREVTLTLDDLKIQDLVEISAIVDGGKMTATSIVWLGAALNDLEQDEIAQLSTENRFEPDSDIDAPQSPEDALQLLP